MIPSGDGGDEQRGAAAAPRARLSLRGIGHRYAGRTVLAAVELDVAPGEVVGVAGPSGSGKSTLLRIAAGLERPSEGAVLAEGLPLWSRRRAAQARYPRRGWAGAVFQDPASSLDPAWTLRRTLDEPFRVPGRVVPAAERHRRVAAVLARVGLAGLSLDRRPTQLSGGQQQRVALARCLLAEPSLLVADEPTSALDVTNSAAVMHLLRDTAAAGTSVLIVSHDRAMLDALADRVLTCVDTTVR